MRNVVVVLASLTMLVSIAILFLDRTLLATSNVVAVALILSGTGRSLSWLNAFAEADREERLAAVKKQLPRAFVWLLDHETHLDFALVVFVLMVEVVFLVYVLS